jgi:release factor glutamine methyltransferase
MAYTLGLLVASAASALSAAGFEDARRQARRLIASALSLSQADLFGHPDQAVDEHQISRVRMMLGRILKHEPLSRIVGMREFWGLQFDLSSDTLEPRPETETVVEAVLKRIFDQREPLRFLDLGTGTGCLLLALLSEFPKASGVGVDIAEQAVRTASRNAANLGISDRAFFFVGDWGAAVSGRFDAIVANPPYIATRDLALLPREVTCYDPLRALDGGADGLMAYRAIAGDLRRVLTANGIFVAEVGVDQAGAVAGIMMANGLVFDGTDKDLAGIARCVTTRRDRMTII